MEIEPHPKDISSGQKTSLRLRVVKLDTSNSKRYELLTREVFDSQFQNGHLAQGKTALANVEHQDEDAQLKVVLEGTWCRSHIVENSLIHLVQPRYDKKSDTYIVDNSSGLLVLEPDNLLTCTAVASTLWCERKTWLNHLFLGQVGSNRAMLVGTLVHEVFQYSLKHKITDLEKMIEFLDEQLDDATIMLEIYSVELHLKDIRDEAITYLGSVKEWIEKYMLLGPAHPLTNDADIEIKVMDVKDIEENVWSTKYGLKGKVDVTGSVRVHDKRTRTTKDKILPLELKTGNPKLSSSHEAQVSLYSMMLEDRYAEYNQGLVIYLKNQAAMHNVTLNHNIKRDLVHRRNELNYYMKGYFFGPEFLNSPRACPTCERATECILMSKIYDHSFSRYIHMNEMELRATGHLNSQFVRFFQKHHEKLVDKMMMAERGHTISENGDTKTTSSFWTYTSAEAESRSSGFGKLQASIVPNSKLNLIKFTRHPGHKENVIKDDNDEKANEMKPPGAKKIKIDDYFTKKKPRNELRTKLKPFDLNFIHSRCRLAISRDDETASMDSQNSSTALAIGFMQELSENWFVLKVYEGALDFIKPNCMYRVDRIEKKINPDIERLVLVRLLAREDWHCELVRQLILDPKFMPSENIDLNLFVTPDDFEELQELDTKLQKHAIDSICTNNYFIFNETMISNRTQVHKLASVLTRVICSLSRKVLVAAQNIDHLVDLMRALQATKTRFIIIDDGKSTKARYQYASHLVKVPQDEKMELSRKFDSYIRQHEMAPIVLSTYAMSIGGLQFTRRTFDYCIAYDCQATELLVALSPLFCCDRFIMMDVRGAGPESVLALTEDDTSLGDHLRKLRTPIVEIDC